MKAKIKIETIYEEEPTTIDINIEFDKGEYLSIIKEVPKIMKIIKGQIKSKPVEDEEDTITIGDDVYYGYGRKGKAFVTQWQEDLDMEGVSISDADILADSPQPGDMICVNPEDFNDRWLIAKDYFEANFE